MIQKRVYEIVFAIVVVFLILFVSLVYFSELKPTPEKIVLTCGDGTLYGTCSLREPLFCNNGSLIEKASICGCNELLTTNGDYCISKYETDSMNISLNYTFRNVSNNINFTVYKGMKVYLSNLPKRITYTGNQTPSRRDFKMRDLNEAEQKELLLPLVTEIQNTYKNQSDQARVAISIVQNIEYDINQENITDLGQEIPYSRYPYEVLYDQKGFCQEKTELLAFILRELGYGVSSFYYKEENHEVLGLKCDVEYSLNSSGYCFVETTTPAIITDDHNEYFGIGKLYSTPRVIILSEGNILDVFEEYKDTREWINIDNEVLLNGGKISNYKYIKWKELINKYGLYVPEYVKTAVEKYQKT